MYTCNTQFFCVYRYMLLLDQYEAVSFGDALFGCFVLVPMMQAHSVTLRRAVWGEHAGVLRTLSVPIREVGQLHAWVLHNQQCLKYVCMAYFILNTSCKRYKSWAVILIGMSINPEF